VTLVLNYGNAVSGAQRFDRPELQAKLLRTLESSGGIKMFGLRRIGKSTLRLYVLEQAKLTGQATAFFDAQGLHSIQDLLGELFSALPKGSLTQGILERIAKDSPIRGVLEALVRGTQTGDQVVAAYWREAYNGIRDALREMEQPPMLVIDEFSLLLRNVLERNPEDGRDQINQLLASMREWRDSGMKMLLTGSIGVTALTRKYDLDRDHLNDLLPFEVPELTEDEARDFVQQATGASPEGRWSDTHTDEFIRQSGVLYPSFLVKGLLEIDIQSPPPPERFARIFDEAVRPVMHQDFYNQFNKRFRFYAEIDQDLQRQLILPVLTSIMDADAGSRLDDLSLAAPYSRIDLAESLEMLVEDGFVHFTEDVMGTRNWVPASRLVRLWWRRSMLA
jgi:hypothetical protein